MEEAQHVTVLQLSSSARHLWRARSRGVFEVRLKLGMRGIAIIESERKCVVRRMEGYISLEAFLLGVVQLEWLSGHDAGGLQRQTRCSERLFFVDFPDAEANGLGGHYTPQAPCQHGALNEPHCRPA